MFYGNTTVSDRRMSSYHFSTFRSKSHDNINTFSNVTNYSGGTGHTAAGLGFANSYELNDMFSASNHPGGMYHSSYNSGYNSCYNSQFPQMYKY